MNNQKIEPLNVSIMDAATMIGCSRSMIYILLDQGKLASVKMGSRRLVVVASIHALNASLAG